MSSLASPPVQLCCSKCHLAFTLSLATSSPVTIILKERYEELKETLVKTHCVYGLRRSDCEEGIVFLVCLCTLLVFCWQPLSKKLGLVLRVPR